jgi:hypothetical protein
LGSGGAGWGRGAGLAHVARGAAARGAEEDRLALVLLRAVVGERGARVAGRGDALVVGRAVGHDRAHVLGERPRDAIAVDGVVAERLLEQHRVVRLRLHPRHQLLEREAHLHLVLDRHEHLVLERVGALVPEEVAVLVEPRVAEAHRVAAGEAAFEAGAELVGVGEAVGLGVAGRARDRLVGRQHRVEEQHAPERGPGIGGGVARRHVVEVAHAGGLPVRGQLGVVVVGRPREIEVVEHVGGVAIHGLARAAGVGVGVGAGVTRLARLAIGPVARAAGARRADVVGGVGAAIVSAGGSVVVGGVVPAVGVVTSGQRGCGQGRQEPGSYVHRVVLAAIGEQRPCQRHGARESAREGARVAGFARQLPGVACGFCRPTRRDSQPGPRAVIKALHAPSSPAPARLGRPGPRRRRARLVAHPRHALRLRPLAHRSRPGGVAHAAQRGRCHPLLGAARARGWCSRVEHRDLAARGPRRARLLGGRGQRRARGAARRARAGGRGAGAGAVGRASGSGSGSSRARRSTASGRSWCSMGRASTRCTTWSWAIAATSRSPRSRSRTARYCGRSPHRTRRRSRAGSRSRSWARAAWS